MTRFLVVLACFVALCVAATSLDLKPHYKFLIIGAGPGGVQAAYFLDLYHMDYAILERSDHPGSFFDKYPRHRKLISINKVYVPSNDSDFAMRHDWNSLLQEPIDDPEAVLFKQFTTDYFPHADKMLEYMKAFVDKHELPIFYGHTVESVARRGGTLQGFSVTYNTGKTVTCDVLLIATGKVPSHPKPMEGAEHLEYYDTMSVNASSYDSKEVLILGSGNSAAETMDALEEYTGHTHIAIRTVLYYAHETHYVGDLRAVNLGMWDKYQLKSLDAVMAYGFRGIKEIGLKKKGDRIFLEYSGRKMQPGEDHAVRRGYHHVIGCLGFQPDVSIFDETCRPRMSASGKFPILTSFYESSNVQHMYFVGTLMHSRDYGKSSGGFIHGFRYLARTLVQYLRQRYANVAFPRETLPANSVVNSILARVNAASSLYQMFGVLADVYILQKNSKVSHLKDVPLDALKSGLPHNITKIGDKYITVTLEYGEDFQGMGVMRHQRQKVSALQKLKRTVVPVWEEDPDEEYKRRFIPVKEWSWPYEGPKEVQPTQAQKDADGDALSSQKGEWTTVNMNMYGDRNNFLHPVVRFWHRHATSQGPRLLATHHVMEDFLTDWTLKEYLIPLEEFVTGKMKELMMDGGPPSYPTEGEL